LLCCLRIRSSSQKRRSRCPKIASVTRGNSLVRPQFQLHKQHIEPSPKFEADFRQVRDFYESELGVQRDARFLLTIDPRDHRAIAQLARPPYQIAQKGGTDTPALMVMVDVNRMLDSEPISGLRPE
jgi:hypothetical protein